MWFFYVNSEIMDKLLILIGTLCIFSVHGLNNVREKRAITIDEFTNSYPVVSSNDPNTQYKPEYNTYPTRDFYQWYSKSGYPSPLEAYPYPAQDRVDEASIVEGPQVSDHEALQLPVLETVYEEPIIEASQAPEQESVDAASSIETTQEPAQETVYETSITPKTAMQEQFHKEPIVQFPQLPMHETVCEASFIQAPPMTMQEELYEAPMETYPCPRHSIYPSISETYQYPVHEAYQYPGHETWQYPVKKAYLSPMSEAYPWPKPPAQYNDLYRSLATKRPSTSDLSNFHNELFYETARVFPSTSASKPMLVDEITKPLIVEHFQAPVVVDHYQKPIIISHFIPPIINDFYEAPEFVEKSVQLELEPLLAAAQQPAPVSCSS